MVTAILTFIVVMLIWCFIWAVMGIDLNDGAMLFMIITAIILAVVVPFGIGEKIPYTSNTITQPIVSIYENQVGDQVYLKTIPGSKLVYWLMEDGVPREQTISAGYVEQVVIEDGKPYIETTKFSFAKKWYKLFAFSDKNDIVVFHVPQTGVETDIISFIK